MVAVLRTASPASAAIDVSASEARIVDAALQCVARWGVAKTSLDDVAREAGCSRATVYRSFPGGKDALFERVLELEVGRFLERVRSAVEAAGDVEEALVATMHEAGRTIAGHPALQYLLVHEPELVLPKLAFRELDDLLHTIRTVAAPMLARFLSGDLERAARVAEWVARITISYTLSPAPGIDTADEGSVRTLVRTFVLPGIDHL